MIYLFIAAIFIILTILFMLNNTHSIFVNLVFLKLENISVALYSVLVFSFGFLLALILAIYIKIKDYIIQNELRKEIKELKRHIEQKNLPLQ